MENPDSLLAPSPLFGRMSRQAGSMFGGYLKGRAGYPHLGGPAAGSRYLLWQRRKVKVPRAGSSPDAAALP
jgi:hypothetical protein